MIQFFAVVALRFASLLNFRKKVPDRMRRLLFILSTSQLPVRTVKIYAANSTATTIIRLTLTTRDVGPASRVWHWSLVWYVGKLACVCVVCSENKVEFYRIKIMRLIAKRGYMLMKLCPTQYTVADIIINSLKQ